MNSFFFFFIRPFLGWTLVTVTFPDDQHRLPPQDHVFQLRLNCKYFFISTYVVVTWLCFYSSWWMHSLYFYVPITICSVYWIIQHKNNSFWQNFRRPNEKSPQSPSVLLRSLFCLCLICDMFLQIFPVFVWCIVVVLFMGFNIFSHKNAIQLQKLIFKLTDPHVIIP